MSAVRWSVPLADVLVDDEIVEAATDAMRSGWWSMGPRVEEFERAFATFCGVEHAVAVSNGTAALQLALLACGCGPGDEVVLPSLNFVAAANAIVQTGATPVFCDIGGPEDLNLDPDDVEAAVSPHTKAILVLHYGGYPCDMDAVDAIAKRHGVVVIEDAAHAPGAEWRGERCGSIGNVGCFSFFSNKNLPIGEGGMIVTNESRIADRVRLLRSHGMTTLTWDRHRGHADTYDVVDTGFNCRMDEIRAAVALVQLDRLLARNEARARIVAEYRRRLEATDGLVIPFPAENSERSSAHHLAVVVLPAWVERAAVVGSLRDRGIQTSVHYPPIHRFSAHKATSQRPLPNTDAVAGRLVTLPLFPHMDDSQVDLVVDSLCAHLAASTSAAVSSSV